MMKTILSNLTEKLSVLENGNLTQVEMELLVEDAKELYERLIVLRYKIYELNVLGPQEVSEPVVSAHIDPVLEVVEQASFDLFEMNDDEAPVAQEVPVLDFHMEEPEIPLAEASLFDVVMEAPEVSAESQIEESTEDRVHEDAVVEESELEVTVIELEETEEEEVFMEEEEVALEDTHVDEESAIITETSANFLDDIQHPESTSINSAWVLQIEQTIRSDRSVFPLETLIGSFSLNEKLQFINELFDGSSDAFSTATKKLDAFENMAQAREQLSEYSSTYNWDLESEIVEDFIFKICRRYATSAS
jgi:hypothetical protein